MGDFVILPLLIFLAFLTIKIFKSKNKIIIKLICYSLSLVTLYIVFTLLIGSFWEKGRRPKIEDEGLGKSIKSIYFINTKNESISIILDFEYSKKEISKYSNINYDYNRLDTFFLSKSNGIGCQTPILFKDTIIEFPENFSIKIRDSSNKIIKTYNKEIFFKNVENGRNQSIQDLEKKSSSWTLKIK